MSKTHVQALSLLALLLLSSAAQGSQISHQTLAEMLTVDTVVVEVLIDKVQRAPSSDNLIFTYDIQLLSTLNGTLAYPPAQAVFTQVSPLIRDAHGKVVGHRSFILPGSGIEKQLEAGKRYWLFARVGPSSAEAVLLFIRAEPHARGDEIRALLDGLKTSQPDVDAE